MEDDINYRLEGDNIKDLPLDLLCGRCQIKPSDVGSTADCIMCNLCEDSMNKNVYLNHEKFPFRIDKIDINKTERFKYLIELSGLIEEFEIRALNFIKDNENVE